MMTFNTIDIEPVISLLSDFFIGASKKSHDNGPNG